MGAQFFSFQWHITDDCDQRCKHCYIFAEDGNKKLISMSWEAMQKVVASMEDFCATYGRSPYLYITGGDPLLHPDFWSLAQSLKEKQIPFTIMGNPFHLTEEVCQRLRACGCLRYQMSIDGLETTHDWFRKPGSYKITLEKIPLLQQAGIHALIMTTVSGKNIDEIPAIIEAVAKAGADGYTFARYCPTSETKDNGISLARYRRLLADCAAKFQSCEAAGYKTYFSHKDHLWTLYEYETGAFQIPTHAQPDIIYSGCNCGNAHWTILPTGDVFACRRVANSRVGNVFQDRLAELWVSEAMEAYRAFDKFEKCGRCELKAWCRGCPAVASSHHAGNFYAADPQCWKEVG